MNTMNFVTNVYESVDSLNPQRLLAHLTEDCQFIFGNAPPALGHAAVDTFLSGFLPLIAAMKHEIDEVLTSGDAIVSRMRVIYTRHDGSRVSYPALVLWKLTGEKIREFRIYVDNSTLFNSAH